jgi:hypothetical protein
MPIKKLRQLRHRLTGFRQIGIAPEHVPSAYLSTDNLRFSQLEEAPQQLVRVVRRHVWPAQFDECGAAFSRSGRE